MSNSSIFESKRNESQIDPRKLSIAIFGGEDRLRNYEIVSEIVSKTVQLTPEIYEINRDDLMTYSIIKSNELKDATRNHYSAGNEVPAEANPVLNFTVTGSIGKFIGGYLLKIMATDEQYQAWGPSIEKDIWMLAYAQTELGHGTDVQGLETIATFDEKTQEFIIHTPSISAIKFWPGDLSLVGTHVVVMARLISNGEFHGVKPFFFPVRDPLTYKPLDGVEIGDIGPKMGMNSKDNGFLK